MCEVIFNRIDIIRRPGLTITKFMEVSPNPYKNLDKLRGVAYVSGNKDDAFPAPALEIMPDATCYVYADMNYDPYHMNWRGVIDDEFLVAAVESYINDQVFSTLGGAMAKAETNLMHAWALQKDVIGELEDALNHYTTLWDSSYTEHVGRIGAEYCREALRFAKGAMEFLNTAEETKDKITDNVFNDRILEFKAEAEDAE